MSKTIFNSFDEAFDYLKETVRRKFRDNRTVFFVVYYYNWFNGWHEFKDARVFTLQEAEEIAREQSTYYLDCPTKVGLEKGLDLSLWFDGNCIFRSELCAEYDHDDYRDVWGR